MRMPRYFYSNYYLDTRYRRTANRHSYLDIVLSHDNDIEDMDISINDECERKRNL